MRLDVERRDRGLGAVDEITEIMAPLLNWDDNDIEREKAAYTARVEQILAAESESTDAAAVAHIEQAI